MDIQLFGRFAIHADRPVQLQTNKIRGLVAYLAAYADRPIERTKLAFLFWPEKTDSVAARNLRNSLSRLRKAFAPLQAQYGDELLTITRRTVQLCLPQGISVDVVQFDHLWQLFEREKEVDASRRVVAQYQGEFLAGLQIDDSIEFDSWVTLQRESYHRRTLQALDWLIEHEIGVEGWESGEQYAHRALALERWHETAHRQLITIYSLTGQRDKAEMQFKRCKQVMWEEFGSEPQPVTVAALRIAPKIVPTSQLRHNLPPEPNPFLGRDAEIDQLQQLITTGNTRLLTLHGEGGIGKTRLARAVGAMQVTAFADGVFFVSLVGINAASEIATTIVETLDMPLQGNRSPLEQLSDYLQPRKMLLIIDNLEHLLDDDETVDCLLDLLDAAPHLVLLITSRQRLWVQAETVVRLHELPYPDELTDTNWARCTAVQLFVTRMRQTEPTFDLTAHREAIVQICQAVQGLPLGIELAAAQSGLWSCESVADGLRKGLQLRTRMRDVPKRQRSLQNVFDYSWRLLDEADRPILARCAIMRGDFSYDAFHAVTGGQRHHLESLITHALVRHVGNGRYDLHELIRQVAVSRLDSTEQNTIRNQFIHHYFQHVQTQSATLDSQPEPSVAAIRQEWRHIQQGWEWAVEAEAIEPLRDVVFSLLTYWSVEHNFNIGEQMVYDALLMLKGTPHPVTRQRLQAVYAYTLDRVGNHDEAMNYANEALVGTDPEAIGIALFTLGDIEGYRGNNALAKEHWEQLIDHARACNLHRWQILALGNLSRILSNDRDYNASRQLIQEGMAMARTVDSRVLEARLLRQMGWLHLHEWRLSEAVEATLRSCQMQAKLTTKRDPFSADWRLSRIYFLLGNYKKAVATLRQVEDTTAINTDINLQVLGRAFYSYALRMDGQLQKAIYFAQLAVATLRQWDDTGIPHIVALNALATAQWAVDDVESAESTINRAMQLLLQKPYEAGFQRMVYGTQAGLYVDIQQYEKAQPAALKLAEIITQCPVIDAGPRSVWYTFLALRDSAPTIADDVHLRGREAVRLRLDRITHTIHRDSFANIPAVKFMLSDDQAQHSAVHLARIGIGA